MLYYHDTKGDYSMKGIKQLALLVCAGIVGAMLGILITTQWPNLSASQETKHEHQLIAHAGQEATCLQAGTRAYWECPQCELYFSDVNGIYTIDKTTFTTWVTTKKLSHKTNENYHVAYQAPTCHQAGHREYYVCSNGCGQYFTDENCQNWIAKDFIVLAKNKHSIGNYVPAEIATCSKPGHREYYECTKCHGTFNDVNCTQPTGDVTVIVNHVTDNEHFNAYQDATCLAAGHQAHYQCLNCDKKFTDENCQNEIIDVEIPQKNHSSYATNHIHYQAPTCETPGNQEYWICENGCAQKFKEVTCDNLVTDAELTIPALGHNFKFVKINESEKPQYTYNNDTFQHGWLSYQKICTNTNCDKFHGIKEVCGFAKLDATNNQTYSSVTTTIDYTNHNDELEVFDLYTLDWNNSTIQNDTTKIVIKLAGTYNISENNQNHATMIDQKGNVIKINEIASINNLTLTVNIADFDTNNILTWQFDWDGDGIYEQTIKVKVINY